MLLRVSKPYPTDVPKDGGFRIRNDGNSGVHEPGSSDQELRHESNVPRQNEGLHGSLGYRQSRDSSNRVNLASKVAMMDEDDFVFHRGRADGVIVRGGFKITPETIDNALRDHPNILDAATVGLVDRRVGSVPGSIIELRRGATAPGDQELDEHIRARLNPLHVPERYLVIDAIPRTTSMKPDLTAVRALLEAVPAPDGQR